jgi:hypothetical protein
LPDEILLVPFLTVIALLGVVPAGTKGAAEAKKLSEFVLGAFGVVVVVRFLVIIATDWRDFASSETLARFRVPPVLTLAVLPFLYGLGLYMAYQLAFTRLGFFMEGEPPLGYAKRAFVRRFRLNLGELREIGSGPLQVKVARASGREEIDALLRNAQRPSRWKERGKQRRRTGAKADTSDRTRNAA